MSGRLRKGGGRAAADLKGQGSEALLRGVKGKKAASSSLSVGFMALPSGLACLPAMEAGSLAACIMRSLDCSLGEMQQEAGGRCLQGASCGAMDPPRQCSIAEFELPSFGRDPAGAIRHSGVILSALGGKSQQGACDLDEEADEATLDYSSPLTSPSPPSSPVSPLPAQHIPYMSPERAAAILRSIALAGSAKGGPRALTGLHNLGNTCYINACVQCLSNSAPLALYFLKEAAKGSITKGTGILPVDSRVTGVHQRLYASQSSFDLGCKDDGRRRSNWDDLQLPRIGLAGGGRESPCNAVAHAEESPRSGALSESCLSSSFGQLLNEMWSAKPMSALSPCDLLKSVQSHVSQFAGYRQHDSQEFLRSFMEKLDEECSQVKTTVGSVSSDELDKLSEADQARAYWDMHMARYKSPIQDIFCGQLQSTIECRSCRRRSHCFDPFLDLSLPIPKQSGSKNVTLMDCVAAFMSEERLENDNAYHCSNCKSPQPAVKKFNISKFPPLLVLHVKRISTLGYHSFQKVSSFVHFDLEGLDFEKFISPAVNTDQRPIYDLYAVCNHTGSISSGHYTAYCKNVDNGLWYCYNDSKVSQVASSAVCSSAAYVLFYQLRDI